MATGQQNINIGTADNANDGDVLRAAFRKVRKMFAEIYGDTDAENLTDTETVPSTSFDTHITEKIEDTVGAMFSGGTQTNVTVTYDDSDGTIDLNVSADITDVNAGAGMTGVNEGGGAATLNVIGGDGITVNADEVEATVDGTTLELSASDGSGAIRIKDLGVSTAKLAADSVTNAKMADDAIDHDQLAARYTESGTLTDGSSITVDTSAKNIYTHTITQATTFNFTNAAIGQVHTLVITGDASNGITLGTINTNSATWNKISGDFDEANAVKNLIEIKFISTSEAWYQISQVAS